jgi:hypothetical protein
MKGILVLCQHLLSRQYFYISSTRWVQKLEMNGLTLKMNICRLGTVDRGFNITK